jgi:hypothetical protein
LEHTVHFWNTPFIVGTHCSDSETKFIVGTHCSDSETKFIVGTHCSDSEIKFIVGTLQEWEPRSLLRHIVTVGK